MKHLGLACLLTLTLTTPVAAQSRLELFGSWAIPTRVVTGTFDTDYTPILVYDASATGRGTQTLRLDGGRPQGPVAGLTWMVTHQAGLQLFVTRASHAIGGANAPSEVQLTYTSRPPPDYTPREVTYQRTSDWPDTSGTLTLWRLGANGLWRLRGSRADLTLSGGVLFTRVQGSFGEASYQEFHLGGHSTLFYEEALARLRFDDGWHVGYNVGAEVAVPLGERIALTAGVRLMPPPSSVSVSAEVVNADQMIFEIPESTVQAALTSRPARFAHWGTPEVTLGLRIAVF